MLFESMCPPSEREMGWGRDRGSVRDRRGGEWRCCLLLRVLLLRSEWDLVPVVDPVCARVEE